MLQRGKHCRLTSAKMYTLTAVQDDLSDYFGLQKVKELKDKDMLCSHMI